jgi:serine/threonine-protein kinase RsbW
MGVAGSNRHGDRHPPRSGDEGGIGGQRGGRRVFSIPSDYAAGRAVQNQILDEVRRNGFKGNSYFAINLALEEAITNAIRHGNKLDPKKKVHVETKVSAKRAEIVVEDEGPGFKRDDIPDPTAHENLEKCSGRGILLIEAYMSRVTWDRGGRRVRMIKMNEPEAP